MDTVYVDIVVAVFAGECVADKIECVVRVSETVSDDIPIGLRGPDYVVRYVHGVCHAVESSGYLVWSQPILV
jgi:hypothetical protein